LAEHQRRSRGDRAPAPARADRAAPNGRHAGLERRTAFASEEMRATGLNARPEVQRQRDHAARLANRRNRTGLPDRLKSGIEAMSGLSLDDVKVHYGSARPARIGAHAYTQGSDIHVAPGQERHLPHEAWHVVQQKQGRVRATRQLKGVDVSDDAGLEREADTMGARVGGAIEGGDPLHLLPAPAAPAAARHVVQRAAVETLGGEFRAAKYEAFNQPEQHALGADMWLEFMPTALVQRNAKMIGLVQTVKTLKTKADNKNDVPKHPHTPPDSPSKAGYKLKEGDVGRGIDKFDVSEFGMTNTNPLYASDNKHSYSSKLNDNVDQAGLGEHWRDSSGQRPAKLIDRPRFVREFAEQAFRQTFEVTALVVEGKLANTYLGSIEWGVHAEAGKAAERSPSTIRLVNVGIPSAGFMAAAEAWNSHDGGKRTQVESDSQPKPKVDVVKLPIATRNAYAHHLMADSAEELVVYLAQAVNGLLRNQGEMNEVDKTNAEFNIKAMEHRLVALKGGKKFEPDAGAFVDKQLASFQANVRARIKDDFEFIFL
jgi:hypothetical protein